MRHTMRPAAFAAIALFAALALMTGTAADSSAAKDPAVVRERTHIAILAYHDIPTKPKSDGYSVPFDLFKAQVQSFIDAGWSFVALSQIEGYYLRGEPLPEKSVHVTFDDGDKGVFVNAHPWLKARGIPHSVYPYITLIQSKRKNAMTWDDLKAMVADGVEVGSHAYDHPILTKPPAGVKADPAKYAAWLKMEIADAKAKLEAVLGVRVFAFSLPFGMADTASMAAIKAAGFTLALNILGGDNGADTDPYNLYRVLAVPAYKPAQLLGLAMTPPLPVRIAAPGPFSVLKPGKATFRIELDPAFSADYKTISLLSGIGPLGFGKIGDFVAKGGGDYELAVNLPRAGWYVLRLQSFDKAGKKAVAMLQIGVR